MKNRKLLCFVLAVVMAFQTFALVACSNGGNSGDTSADTSASSGDSQSGSDKKGVAKYRISFYTGSGASQVETVSGLEAGDEISAPEDPRWARHSFKGWFTDYGTFENEFDFTTMPDRNLVLYAKWESTTSDNEIAEYEQSLAETSEEGRFYLHYMRFDNDPDEYEPWDIWVWPYQQTGRTFDWERDENGKVIVDDVAGATCIIDMTVKYTDAGKTGDQETQFLKDSAIGGNYTAGAIKNPANYMDPRMGFLVVKKSSKDIQGQHWQSDGNADHIFNISEAVWDNGSLHVFCVQDNVSDFVYHLSDQKEIVNPYENDDGTHVSSYNVNSSETLKVNDVTSLLDTVSGVGYQIMVSSFADSDGDGNGDIRGIIENLDYIEKLNVDVLWLTPIQLSDSYHGYDIIDYKEVDPKFGTLDDYKELLTKCHQKGIKVIMDLVLNHTSTNNVWFQKSVKMIVEDGIDYRNFYQWKNHTVTELSDAWYPYSEYNYSYYAKFSPSMPELNYDNKDTREAIVDVAKYWLGILGEGNGGVDGFRIDAVKHIYMADEIDPAASDILIEDYDEETATYYNSNVTKNINFFTYFSNEIKKKYPNAYLVGENFDGHAYNVAPYYTAYDGMLDFYMYYQFGEIANAAYHNSAATVAGAANGATATYIGKNTNLLKSDYWSYEGVLRTQAAYRKDGLVNGYGTGDATVMGSLFTSNHDIPRLMNNVIRTYRSANDWSAGTVNASNAAYAQKYAKAVIGTMMTMPGISWIYYGDEIGMSSNYYSGENAKSPHADRAYRQPFKWTTANYNETGGSKYITHISISGDVTLYVDWDDYNKALDGVNVQDTDANSFLNAARYWTKLKSTDEVLRYGDYHYDARYADWGAGASPLFTFNRTYNGVTYLCITNFSEYDYTGLSSKLPAGAQLIAKTGGGNDLDSLSSCGTMVIKV